jgi:hypothetical protein
VRHPPRHSLESESVKRPTAGKGVECRLRTLIWVGL